MKQIGGKGQSGVYQRIINLIPWHRVYLEPFLGSGAIMRRKAPAEISIGVDLIAPKVTLPPAARFILGDGIDFLKNWEFKDDEFVYCDPPYVLSTRGGRRYYRHEMTDADHRRLLKVILAINANVLISGYPCALYEKALRSWRSERFEVMTRGHTIATECLWFNYVPPAVPIDTRYFGKNYRDRLRLKRKVSRWVSRLLSLPGDEREYLLTALQGTRAGSRSAGSDAEVRSAGSDAEVRSAISDASGRALRLDSGRPSK